MRLSRGSPSRALPRVALDLATTVERIQSVRAMLGRGAMLGASWLASAAVRVVLAVSGRQFCARISVLGWTAGERWLSFPIPAPPRCRTS